LIRLDERRTTVNLIKKLMPGSRAEKLIARYKAVERDFSKANLRGANLTGANLTGAT
jgi:uncharacterized protein YjbI with pentapeptide repeats